eukprot:CAMPEP_0203679988 /NCGR_PEP_ID=MMETSP0090-20130426/37724_1 /ASSEMBLY_ACC=CAM_ASM_001088 /TAXON_ID=426623 /ORGANISM="Chaetoceros affinis, Strain CCMP159" /LENGTH=588 /DNA_ID=CAMNT_0050547859 /DNA_START=120 /DNA_END=1886 /DNA_ORIENTATION=-
MTERSAGAVIESSATTPSSTKLNPRGSTDIETYYEIHRIASEIVMDQCSLPTSKDTDGDKDDDREFLCKVALQFPDELLDDAAEVCWLIEDEIIVQYNEKVKKGGLEFAEDVIIPPLVFVLGDTTYSSCCPDEIGALHLDADVIVHYGQYACLSPPQCLPVIYSFGVLEWAGVEECIESVLQHIGEKGDEPIKLLLLCERRYHQYMETISIGLMKDDAVQEVIVGSVPIHNTKIEQLPTPCNNATSCCKEAATQIQSENEDCCDNQNNPDDGMNIGGLRIPIAQSSLPCYTLLYVGDDSGASKSRQFMNTILRCTSPTNKTKECWSYNPEKKTLSTDPSSLLGVSRYLNRRFYLTQKAQLASIVGILVGTLSQDRFRTVISSVRQKILDSGRACYTFVVGKINVAKLANFAEIECFVLISCGETSVLQDEREFHLPVITPAELDIVLGEKVWGGSDSCNTDFGDFLKDKNEEKQSSTKAQSIDDDKDDENSGVDDESEDDEPFFSMISGTYIAKPTVQRRINRKGIDGRGGDDKPDSQPSEGQMVEYKSDAAEFWKKREYKGLEAKIGQTEVKAAIEGQTGIASDYGK